MAERKQLGVRITPDFLEQLDALREAWRGVGKVSDSDVAREAVRLAWLAERGKAKAKGRKGVADGGR